MFTRVCVTVAAVGLGLIGGCSGNPEAPAPVAVLPQPVGEAGTPDLALPPPAAPKPEVVPAKPKRHPYETRYRDSRRFSGTGVEFCHQARVLAVTPTTITVVGSAYELSVRKQVIKERTYPFVDVLIEGRVHEWVHDSRAYLPTDVRVGDLVELPLIEDQEDHKHYVYEIKILDRPGGQIPPSQRAGQNPPYDFTDIPPVPYHVWKNVDKALKAGEHVPEDLQRFTGHLPKLKKAPVAMPPAKE